MDLKNIKLLITQLAQEKGIPEQRVLETVEAAFASAYKKDYGKRGQKIKAQLDLETGQLKFWQVKLVVDEKMILTDEELEARANALTQESKKQKELPEGKVRFNPERHILIEEAKKINPKIKVGEELEIPLETREDYGRIAAQTAKQVILQKIREAEKEIILEEYQTKEGEIISGIVQRIEKNKVFFDIGKVLGILSKEEQIPGEFYKLGQRFKLYVLKVEKGTREPLVFLSRAFPKFVTKLFELEVPEISAGQVVIKAIAREAGSRTKIAVKSEVEEIDPIGAVVGQRGARVMAVITELGGEKIDIIEYNDDPAVFIKNALLPAKVLEVKIMPRNKALCLVPEDQLSLAIGKDGQNVRLAAKLTGWKIDVKSIEKPEEELKEERVGAVKEEEPDDSSKEELKKEEVKNKENGNKTEEITKSGS